MLVNADASQWKPFVDNAFYGEGDDYARSSLISESAEHSCSITGI
jgi:hypothetical protein